MREHDRAADLAGSWEWLRYAAQLPAKSVPFAGAAADMLLYSGRCLLTGGVVNNGNAGGQTFALRDGQDASGVLLYQVFLNTGSNAYPALPPNGVLCEIGVWAHVSGGPMSGSVFVVPLWHGPRTPPGD